MVSAPIFSSFDAVVTLVLLGLVPAGTILAAIGIAYGVFRR